MAPHGRLSVVLGFALTSTSTVVVALRFYTRYFVVGKLTAADWVMLLALIATWSSEIVNWYMVQIIDESAVNLDNLEVLDKLLVKELLFLWIYRLNYIIDLCLIKTSILLFYSGIAASNKRFRFSVRALLAIIIGGGVGMALASIFMCYPVADAWALEVPTEGFVDILAEHCYLPSPIWLFNAGYNLVTDVIIWSIPMVFFLKLRKLPLGRRLGLIAIFSIGSVAIVASAVRIRVVVLWLSSFEQQDLNTGNLILLSQVEQHAGLVAGSAPFLRPLIRQVLNNVRSKRQASGTPEEHLVEEGTPDVVLGMFRRPIIPSTTSSMCGSSTHEFRRPQWDLEPIEPVPYTSHWDSAPPPRP